MVEVILCGAQLTPFYFSLSKLIIMHVRRGRGFSWRKMWREGEGKGEYVADDEKEEKKLC